jgi:3-methyl-2-oxobutanoate hydroxymethyltransferase
MNIPALPAGGPADRHKISLTDIAGMKRRRERIAMVTVYDAPAARLADLSGVELVLVGDSAAMTMLGHESTIPVTVDEMLMLTRAVTRGARRPVVVADLPFGSFQISDEAAIANAVRFIKEAGADAVKLEGAGRMLSRVRAILEAGVPVMGHVGLTPQSAMLLGGLKAQGRTARAAQQFVHDALALEHAGCFAVVVEAVPAPVAARITEALTIPTIGIGAGPSCDGQVLVWHDLLGITAGRVPKFVKQYADLAGMIRSALEAYVADVRSGKFPEAQHTYAMSEDEREQFESALAAQTSGRGPHS